MKRDKNHCVYTLKVPLATAVPSAGSVEDKVVIEIQGNLSRKAKTDITRAIQAGNWEIREKKHVVI